MSKKITSHRDLEVYQKAFSTSMDIFELSKHFPKEETYSLTDQVADLLDPRVQTSLRHGANVVMRKHLLASSRMLRAKPLRLKCGSNLPFTATTWLVNQP